MAEYLRCYLKLSDHATHQRHCYFCLEVAREQKRVAQVPSDPVRSALWLQVPVALVPMEEEGLEVLASSSDCGSSLVHELVILEVMEVQVQRAVQSAHLHLMNSLNLDSDRLGFNCDGVVLKVVSWTPRWAKRWL